MSAHDRILPPEAASEDPGHSGTPRGEMNRLTVWRTRMDATTSWAIIK